MQANNQIWRCDQSKDGKSSWSRSASFAHRPCRRGDRI